LLPDLSRDGRFPAAIAGGNRQRAAGNYRRPSRETYDALNDEELKQLRESLAHLSPEGVRHFYERAFEDCRLVYNRPPSPRKMQTLVQVWKQLWKCR